MSGSGLTTVGLSKAFGPTAALAELSFHVRPGELYALLGANGAGKTTALRIIAGLLAPDAGSVEIFGVDALAEPARAKQLTAWVPDEPMLYERLTPWEHLEFIAGLWNLDPAEAQPRAEALLRRLGLWEVRSQRCGSFSRGMMQKTALAGALLHAPRLLLLDEPLTGLDARMAREVKDMLRELVAAGASLVLTTHILEVAERMADRIGILHRGRLMAEGSMEELRRRTQGAGTLEEVFLELTVQPAAAGP
ncbi:MAG TPA: ABC transporter ATP-binding protein [Phenylobacterium sp.]|uniref:ABC transporter ATP-binding protein n=1 Tax=Phenylobacterium sp. TaxID=1871053 RepID=UPI002C6FF43F|nr:ABC transporter ATP-binding protein [Phenylobacterium sp.]HSV01815.1 ABC transporter ATP-binding protein [Phenylobacterium sp.]